MEVEVPGYGKIEVDIGYGGAFYVMVSAEVFGLDVRTSSTAELLKVGTAVSGRFFEIQESMMGNITLQKV